jgi:hypothetical protein
VAQINTMLRMPYHGVYTTIGELVMQGEFDEEIIRDEPLDLDVPSYTITESTDADNEYVSGSRASFPIGTV